MKRRNSIRLFSAMAAAQKGTTKTTSRKASRKLKQGTVFHDIERSQGHRQRHGEEHTRGVNAPLGHSNSLLLLFSAVEWSGISRSHEGTRTDEGLLEICQSAESGSAAQHIFLEEDEDATRGEYKELIWLPVCGAVVDDPNLRKEGAKPSSSRIIPGTLFIRST